MANDENLSNETLPDNLLIEELGLPKRVCNALLRARIRTVAQLVTRSDEELLSIWGVGVTAIEEIRRSLRELPSMLSLEDSEAATSPPNRPSSHDLKESNLHQQRKERERIAQEHGINNILDGTSWINLLEEGYEWQAIEALNKALSAAALPLLVPLPLHTMVSSAAVAYLLRIGCPLSKIPARRITLDRFYRRLMAEMNLKSVIQVCLADQDSFVTATPNFQAYKTDVNYYIEWLGTQSDWTSEIDESCPSPMALARIVNISIDDLMDRILAGIAKRHRDILLLRLGLTQDKYCTLQDIADRFGISRERVRQICDKAVDRIQQTLQRDEILRALLWFCKHIIDQIGVIQSEALVGEVAEHSNIQAGDSWRLIPFILEVSDHAQILSPLGLIISCDIPVAAVEAVIKSIRSQLTQARAPIRLPDLAEGVKSSSDLGPRLRENLDLIQTCLEAVPQFVHVENDYWGLRSWESRVVDDIVMVLRQLGRPAHFREITEVVNQRLEEDQRTAARLIHAQLAHHKLIFARTGPGTFALKEWDPQLPSQPTKFIDLIEQVLREENKPLSLEEIFRRVNTKRAAKMSSITMYVTLHQRFAKFDNNAYGLNEWRRRSDLEHEMDRGGVEQLPSLPDNFLEHLKAQALNAFASDRERHT